MANSYLKDSLSKKVIFFTGKGGVGKSSVAWATALLCRQQGKKVVFVSWNPLDSTTKPVPHTQWGIRWDVLSPTQCFHEYAMKVMKFEKLYDLVFENQVLKSFISAAPGLSEAVLAGKIWDLQDHLPDALLIVDLPASGHAVSFFQSPLGMREVFSKGLVHQETERVCELFESPTTRLDLVTLPEELPVTETEELKEKLDSLHAIHFGYLHFNQCTPEFSVPETGTSPAAKELLQNYSETLKLENESKKVSKDWGISTLSLSKLTTSTFHSTVEALAKQLEAC